MKFTFRKKILLAVLLSFFTAVLFYLNNKSEKSGVENSSDKKTKYTFDASQINKISGEVTTTFQSFGIKESWIKPLEKSDAAWFAKEVSVPRDIVSSDVIFELTNLFGGYNLKDKVYEEPRSKNITFEAYNQQDSALIKVIQINLVFNDSLNRNNKYITLIFDELEKYPLQNVEKVLDSPRKYSVILPLSNDKSDYQAAMLEHGKDYLLKFSVGNEEDLASDFRTDMPEKSWKGKIKTTALAYYKASGVILTGKGEVFPYMKEIGDEFINNNMKVYLDTMFIEYKLSNDEDNKDVKGLIKDIQARSEGRDFLFYLVDLSPENFIEYDKEIYTLKKRGFKFLTFKNIMRRILKLSETENQLP